ncbi:MAG: lipid-binding SYLF domain-containing protein [Deltaproteobacteria bacterium]|nr:lipid-binding SYLF domain-containing protein [Deltaproteobacteria bacterium]
MPKIALSLALFVTALSWPAVSCSSSLEELDRQLAQCDAVLKAVSQMPDRGIPKDLMMRCRGLAIFPGVVEVGAVLAVRYGRGVVMRRSEQTGMWSKPAFFTIRGGSIGAQLGAQSVDLILLVMSEMGVQALLEERFTLGADIAVSAGPIGRGASAETNLRFDTGILSYSRSKGLFAGISVTGAALEPDFPANELYHGKGITVQDVFYEDMGTLSEAARSLIKTLDEATP